MFWETASNRRIVGKYTPYERKVDALTIMAFKMQLFTVSHIDSSSLYFLFIKSSLPILAITLARELGVELVMEAYAVGPPKFSIHAKV